MAKFLKSAAIGFGLAVAVGAFAIAIAPFFDFTQAYLAPARVLFPSFGVLQAEVALRILSNEPAPAGLYAFLALALLFWTLIFGAIYFVWSTRRRPLGKTTNSAS